MEFLTVERCDRVNTIYLQQYLHSDFLRQWERTKATNPDLVQSIWHPAYHVANFYDNNLAAVLCRQDGKTLGVVTLRLLFGDIDMIHVLEEYRGKGIGKTLVEKAIVLLREKTKHKYITATDHELGGFWRAAGLRKSKIKTICGSCYKRSLYL